jgi:hypothetical protein
MIYLHVEGESSAYRSEAENWKNLAETLSAPIIETFRGELNPTVPLTRALKLLSRARLHWKSGKFSETF